MTSADRPLAPRRLAWWLALALFVGLALTGAALAAWWFQSAKKTALAPAWPARVSVLAGTGQSGFVEGDVTRAQFSDPFGVAVGSDGTIYVSDAGEAQRIRRISPAGHVSTLAGGERGFVDGPGPTARFDTPSGLAVDMDGMLYVADTGNNAIRRITAEGHVSTVAGNGRPGYRDGVGREALFNGPIGVAVDRQGRILVADTYNDRIRVIDRAGAVSTLAGGSEPGFDDGTPSGARFDTPSGIAVGSDGTAYVADTGNNLVRVIDPAGHVRTPAWWPPEGLVRPIGIVAGPGHDLYVTDDRGSIVHAMSDGTARALAGSIAGFRDGDGSIAQFRQPAGLAIISAGRLVVADAGNAVLRLVEARGQGDLPVPPSPLIAPGFRLETFALQPLLWPIEPLEGPHEIAGTLGEIRGGAGAERFHAGIDVRAREGTAVLAVRDGVVNSPIASGDFGSLNEWLRVGPVSYVHMRVGRWADGTVLDGSKFVTTYDAFGKLARIRVKRGARFSVGETIGTINPFNHVHLNIGWPGAEYNPLRFRLVQFDDTVPPTIARDGIRLFDEFGKPITRRARGRVVVSGRVQVVVDAWDQSDANMPDRRLGVYELGYQVLHRDGTPAPGYEHVRRTLRFDRLPGDAHAAKLVYAPGSGIPFYSGGRTRFLYTATNTLGDGVAGGGYWDTTILAPGDYVLRIWAADIHGNAALANRDLRVTVVALGGGSSAGGSADAAASSAR